jgi:hypothetical protein
MTSEGAARANEYDVVVIGAGAGGMTAAAVAATRGLSAIVIEKTGTIGGTTAISGGMVWVPNMSKGHPGEAQDTLEQAAAYLEAVVGSEDGADLRRHYLAEAPKAIDYLERHTHVRLSPVPFYPDYYPDLPGATLRGRVLEPVAFDGQELGDWFPLLRPPLPEFTLFGGMMVARTFAKSSDRCARWCAFCASSPAMRPSACASSGARASSSAMRWPRAFSSPCWI